MHLYILVRDRRNDCHRRSHLHSKEHVDEEGHSNIAEGQLENQSQHPTLQQQQEQQHPSDLRHWIDERRNAKREKRERRKSLKKNGNTPAVLTERPSSVVKVRLMVAEQCLFDDTNGSYFGMEDGTDHNSPQQDSPADHSEQSTQQLLMAIVDTSLLSRIACLNRGSISVENERAEQQGWDRKASYRRC